MSPPAALARFGGRAHVGVAALALFAAAAFLAPVLPLADPARTELAARLLAPGSTGHLLGTDQLGRDLLSRLLFGARLSLMVAAAGSVTAALLGSALGMIAGYRGGWVDALAMRALDVLLAFPYLLFALAIVAALGPGLGNAAVAIAIVNVPFFARTVRGVTLELREAEFVAAARVAGITGVRMLWYEILPNVLPTIAVAFSASIGWVLLETAGLSFLGLGAQPPDADLGGMLGEGRRLLAVAPHVSLIPGAVILVVVAALNLLGDTLRDALDPRLRHAQKRSQTKLPSEPLLRVPTDSGSDAESVEAASRSTPLVEVVGLALTLADAQPLRGVSFSLQSAERVALVGESGSGKSITARALLGLLPNGARGVKGEVRLSGASLLDDARAAQRARGRRVALVPQDPLGSLHPLFRVGDQAVETLDDLSAQSARARAVELFTAVELPHPATLVRSFPHELSGGMRQRVAIAMALAHGPDLLVADEPTTALDATTQRAILALLRTETESRKMTLLFVTHDLAVASELCERVLVMQHGRIVEDGPIERVFDEPQHPYTRELLAAARHKGRRRSVSP